MERNIVEVTVAENVSLEELKERFKTFQYLSGKAFSNSAKEAMQEEREVSEK